MPAALRQERVGYASSLGLEETLAFRLLSCGLHAAPLGLLFLSKNLRIRDIVISPYAVVSSLDRTLLMLSSVSSSLAVIHLI